MRFWDASALVPLLVTEASTRRLQALASDDPAMLVWWGSEVECVSALARVEREGALPPGAIAAALQRLRELAAAWHEVDPSDGVREAALETLPSKVRKAVAAYISLLEKVGPQLGRPYADTLKGSAYRSMSCG